MKSILLFACAMVLAAAGGCAPSTALSSGHNAALDSVDLTSMTDQMAASLGGEPRVRQEMARNGKLIVVVQPVENRLTGEILPEGQAEMFVARVRLLLSNHAPETFTWIMNRDSFYNLRQRQLDVDLGPAPGRIQPQYALTARFQSITDESSRGRIAAYLCVYRLTNLKTGVEVWTDKYEVKKTAMKGFLD